MSLKKFDVGILLGSKSDWPLMQAVSDALKEFGIEYDVRVLSAHRAPGLVIEYVRKAEEQGASVFICGAGSAAHLAGMVAAHTALPVIGVPVESGALKGFDALLSTVQMPKGVPVATVAVNGAYNAGILAVQILSMANSDLRDKLRVFKKEMENKIKESADLLQKDNG